ncbi:hypothetical protein C2G38_2168158 [Gigaspora rosea]|uniref:Zn(2)-C6 fungal-type domain-containing protein n=1 Tax=Gigaspora rosea TaxID=44941 RepID=A0A397VX91_9GLOM|nr:hypothetical protein C2G38_2168158 [Gigaspora rosea]CAG8539351.1 26209_t:CDS:2 [Gigaspora rosea]
MRENYVKRACSRCKVKKIRCVKEDGLDCKTCIGKKVECVPQGDAKKRGPKPRPPAAPSSKSSEIETNEHLSRLSQNDQLPEKGHKQYQLFMTKKTMINGDNGGYYESGQNHQLFNRISTQVDVDQSFMINGGNSHPNFYPTQQDDSVTEFITELNKSSTMEEMPQKHFEQPSKDTSFHLNQKLTPESIQNGLSQVGENKDHNVIVQDWNDYWTNHLKEKGL